MLLLLLGCNNTLETPRGVPLDISGLGSALWKTKAFNEYESYYAEANILLSTNPVQCGAFLEQDFQGEDTLWRGDHVLLSLYWYFQPYDWSDYEDASPNPGWAGDYGSNVSARTDQGDGMVQRSFSAFIYDNGVRYAPYTEVGTLAITWDGGIQGDLDHPSVTSRFSATDCGVQDSGQGDSGWYE